MLRCMEKWFSDHDIQKNVRLRQAKLCPSGLAAPGDRRLDKMLLRVIMAEAMPMPASAKYPGNVTDLSILVT